MAHAIFRADERGGGEYGWLSTRYSFSFADWYDPARMGFGALRVLNDDTVAPSSGFGMHAHQDMEIITIVTRGTVTHADSMGNQLEVPAGDVQVMSAGTGVRHAEENLSPDEPLTLFQIWITPEVRGRAPRYAQKSFGLTDLAPGIVRLVGPDEAEGALSIGQNAYIHHVVIDGDHPASYALKNPAHGAYVFVLEGSAAVLGETLSQRDAIAITGEQEIHFSAGEKARLLVIEVPVS